MATILMMRCGQTSDLELARVLKERGHVVYATASDFKSVGRLQAQGIRVDSVNLDDWASVKEFMCRLQADNAAVNLVVNNNDLGTLQTAKPASAVHEQYDFDMVAAFAILNLFGFTSGPFKRVVNIIRAPDWSPIGIGSRFNAGRKLLRKLCQAEREKLEPFGVEVTALEASGAPTKKAGSNDIASQYWQEMADLILAAHPPAVGKFDGTLFLPPMLRRKPNLVG